MDYGHGRLQASPPCHDYGFDYASLPLVFLSARNEKA